MLKYIVNSIWIVVVGFLGAAVLWIIASPPRGEPIVLRPAPTPSPILVYVTGAVENPGVFSLSRRSRIKDAIDAAGGTLINADISGLNLAGWVEDGDRIEIPTVKPTQGLEEIIQQVQQGEPSAGKPEQEETVIKVNINLATQTDLESLPGIGPATAEKIVQYRKENGYFQTIEEIQNVSGIGPAKFELIKNLITVTN